MALTCAEAIALDLLPSSKLGQTEGVGCMAAFGGIADVMALVVVAAG